MHIDSLLSRVKRLPICILWRGREQGKWSKNYVDKMRVFANVYACLQEGGRGEKSPKFRLRRMWTPPYCEITCNFRGDSASMFTYLHASVTLILLESTLIWWFCRIIWMIDRSYMYFSHNSFILLNYLLIVDAHTKHTSKREIVKT